MSERQGQWILSSSKEELDMKIAKLDEYLFDVIVEKAIKTCCPWCGKGKVRAFVHYIV